MTAVAVFGGLLGLAVQAQAELYQFIDSNGIIHFSNVPTDPRFKRISEGAPVVQIRPQDIHQLIQSTSRRYRMEPALVKAVIKVESDFNPRAVSNAGAMGLMQLMPATASTLGVQDPFNPSENIAGGVKHLSELLDRFDGDLTLALAAYHAGAKTVEQYGRVPPIDQTHRYIYKVLSAYKTYRGNEPGRNATYKVVAPNGQVIYTNVPEQYPNSRGYRVAYVK